MGLMVPGMAQAQEVVKHDTVYLTKVDTVYVAKAVVIQEPVATVTDSVAEAAVDSTAKPKRNSWGAKLKESPVHLGIELQTKYMWRGIEYGTAPTFIVTYDFPSAFRRPRPNC